MNNFTRHRDDEAIIAVMGQTGSGKSSFIKLLTEDPGIRIGHNLDSASEAVQLSCFHYRNERNVTFVDTPGFDDSRSGVTDADILRSIAAFMINEYDGGRKLTGVIYLHPISGPRAGAVSRANIQTLVEMCGSRALMNVVVATTFWGNVTEVDGIARTTQLKTAPDLFQPIISSGGKIMRHDKGLESARLILDAILSNTPRPLLLQEELAQTRVLCKTTAGSGLEDRIEKLFQKQQEEMRYCREQMEALRTRLADEGRRPELEKLRHELEARGASLQADKWKLETVFPKAKSKWPWDKFKQTIISPAYLQIFRARYRFLHNWKIW